MKTKVRITQIIFYQKIVSYNDLYIMITLNNDL